MRWTASLHRALARLAGLSAAIALLACAPMEVSWPENDAPSAQAIKPAPSVPPRKRPRPPPPLPDPTALTGIEVWLYVSPASQTQLMAWGADPTTGLRIWENYLRDHAIAHARISGAQDLNRIDAKGILLLGSTVVLSDAEKLAIAHWRDRGGAVLSTWLTASHDENGRALGDAFMREVLDVQVVGNTQDEVDDTFMIVHGDNPLTHQLPAGSRVWLERVPKQLPLRLVGKQEAAQIMSWSRTYDVQKPSGLVAYHERKMPSGRYSRSATLGYAEQNWLRSDPKQLHAVASGVLNWLWRRPAAYLGAWPNPYQSGFLMALQAGEMLSDADVALGKAFAALGGRGTFYVHAGNAAKALSAIRAVKAQGHDIGYFSDRFEGFQGQSEAVQRGRLDTMHKLLEEAKIPVSVPASFSTPMDAYDKVTQRLLLERGYDNYLAFMEVTDSALPVLSQRPSTGSAPTVVLPRTLIGPEETIESEDPDAAWTSYLKLLGISVDMGGLIVMRLPSQTLLTPEQRKQLFDTVASLRPRIWMASANQIAQWWRNRERVTVALEPQEPGLLLRVRVAETLASSQPLVVWVNLPHPNRVLRLQPLQKGGALARVAPEDNWRAAIVLGNLAAGEYTWRLQFEEAPAHAQR